MLDARLDFNTVFHQMDSLEIAEANAAYDLYLTAQKKGKQESKVTAWQ